jgi:hypothetical protein
MNLEICARNHLDDVETALEQIAKDAKNRTINASGICAKHSNLHIWSAAWDPAAVCGMETHPLYELKVITDHFLRWRLNQKLWIPW